MGYALENLRVLIVDPNAPIRDLLRTILHTVGTSTIELTSDGEAGFERYCDNEYDVVFTETEMEPVSGLDLVDLIRTSAKSPNPYVPILILSAYSDEDRVKAARDHGATEFLAKPFSVGTILQRIEDVIENPRSFVRTASYFGPDRRRKSSLDYSGAERRTLTLREVSLSKHNILQQQQAALNERASD